MNGDAPKDVRSGPVASVGSLDQTGRWSPPGLGIAVTALSAAIFGFGTTFAVFAYQGGSNPLTVVLLRTSAFVVVVGIALGVLGRLAWLPRRALIGSLWMAATLIVVSLGYQGSVAFIPVSLAALLFYGYPLLVGLLAVVAGRDRMTIPKAVSLVAAFVGVALALSPGFDVLDWRGIGLAFAAALAMALSVTFGGRATRGEDALLMSVYTNVWMLIVLILVAVPSGNAILPVTRIGVLGAAGVCLTYVIAYSCWYLALGLVRPVRLALLFNIEPLVTLAVARLALGERMSAAQIFGAVLVLGALISVTLAHPSEAKNADRGLRDAP